MTLFDLVGRIQFSITHKIPSNYNSNKNTITSFSYTRGIIRIDLSPLSTLIQLLSLGKNQAF